MNFERNNKETNGPSINVRKSVFIGKVIPVNEEKTARNLVKEIKQNDRKAAHVAFAFRIGENPCIEGMSDDREPRGTAGLPILMLLRNKNLTNLLVTVKRYWGGVKLGKGNLKRAYLSAAKSALDINTE